MPKYRKFHRDMILEVTPVGRENAIPASEISEKTGIFTSAIGTLVRWYLKPQIGVIKKDDVSYYYRRFEG